MSRWDGSVAGKTSETLGNRLGIAVAQRTYQAYRGVLNSPRWQRIYNAGARPQRLLWASTGTKNPEYSDVLYVSELIGPDVVNTMPAQTLRAFAEHGEVEATVAADPGVAARALADAQAAGIDLTTVTDELEREGVQSFCDSYRELLDCIEAKLGSLVAA